MKSHPSSLLRLVLVAALGPACTVGGPIVGGQPDASPSDAGSSDTGSSDTGVDVVSAPADVVDAAVVDVPPTPVDAPVDVPLSLVDVPGDVGGDVSLDAGVDVAVDVPVDMPIDVPVDIPVDMPIDVAADVPIDIPADMPVDVPTDTPVALPCPADSSGFMGQCYRAFTTVPPSTAPFNYWDFAENECRTRFTGGHLVSINSAMENAFVRALLPTTQSIMIGFADASRAINNYVWFDGSTVGYTNWNPGQPDNRTVRRFTSDLTEDFGLMLPEGTWFDVPYADGNPYVCQFPPPSPCPAGSTSFMGHCYQAFTTVPPSTAPFNYWDFAENDCRTRFSGGHLVSIASAMENAFVRTLVPTTQGIMIGFADAGRAVNSYAWFDGSTVAYTNWNPGQPDNRTVRRFTSDLTEDFGLMLPEGTWFDVPYADGNPYVCEL